MPASEREFYCRETEPDCVDQEGSGENGGVNACHLECRSSHNDLEPESGCRDVHLRAKKGRYANDTAQLETSEDPRAGSVGPVARLHPNAGRAALIPETLRNPNTRGRAVQNRVEDSGADDGPFAEISHSKPDDEPR